MANVDTEEITGGVVSGGDWGGGVGGVGGGVGGVGGGVGGVGGGVGGEGGGGGDPETIGWG